VLNILYDAIILESFMSFYHDHMTVTVSCDMCCPSCDLTLLSGVQYEVDI